MQSMSLDMPKNIRTSKCGMIQTKGDKQAENLTPRLSGGTRDSQVPS